MEKGNTQMARTSRKIKNANIPVSPVVEAPEPVVEVNEQPSVASGTFTRIEGDNVISRYAIRKTDGGNKYMKETVFDFSGIDRPGLMALAMYGVKVKAQSLLRDMTEAQIADPGTFAHVNVLAQIVNTTRAKADPLTKAIRALMAAGLSEAAAKSALEAGLKVQEAQQ
jgi:hypothetical protein